MVKFTKEHTFRGKTYKIGDTLKCSKSIQDLLVETEKVAKPTKEEKGK